MFWNEAGAGYNMNINLTWSPMIKKKPKQKSMPPNNLREVEIQETSNRTAHPRPDVFP